MTIVPHSRSAQEVTYEAANTLFDAVRRFGIKHRQGVDKAGQPLSWLLDCRDVLSRAECFDAAGTLFWKTIQHLNATHVGGVTYSAAPITCAVLAKAAASRQSISGFFVRREPKKWGLRRVIEGAPIVANSRIVIVDDVLNSGSTVLYAMRMLARHNVRVVGACFLVNFEKRGETLLRDLRVPTFFAFTLREIRKS